MIKIPGQTKQWSQLNKGDLLGTLFSTRNVDLNSPGVIKLSQRSKAIASSNDIDFSNISSISYGKFGSTNPKYWIMSNFVYTLNSDLTTFALDVLSDTPTLDAGSDSCKWNNNLYVTKNLRVAKLSTSGVWTTDWSDQDFQNTGTDAPHPIEPNYTNANLLVGDGNLLKSIDSAGTINIALTFSSNYKINWIRKGTNSNYISLESIDGSNGAIAIWDGQDTTIEANYLIPLTSKSALSGCLTDEGIFYIIQSDGRLGKYNGSSFSYEAELPPFRDYNMRYGWGNTYSIGQGINKRGMTLIRGKIHLVIDTYNDRSSRYNPNFLSGVWVYDTDNKAFYHKYSATNSTSTTDFGQNAGVTFVSALCPVYEGLINQAPNSDSGGVLLVGAKLNNSTATGTNNVLVSLTTGENRGQFSTCRIESQGVTDTPTSIWCKYEGINTSSDKIIFKYKNKKRVAVSTDTNTPIWTSTSTFTSSDTAFSNAEIGDELLILEGNGAGCTTHISNIKQNAELYTITVDEVITNISVGNKGRMLIENWKRMNAQITYLDTEGFKVIALPKTGDSTWIELRAELRGEGGVVGIQELQLVSSVNQKAI